MTLRVPIMHVLGLLVLYGLLATTASARAHYRTFEIKEAMYTRLCHTKKILTVNGQYPGPTIYARKGDTLFVKVINHANANITLHWHGVKQPRNPWSDGPEYITQCPIHPGTNFTYKVQFTDEEGSLFWHAHSGWDRATVHGAIFIYPKRGVPLPYAKPDKEFPVLIGEWWNGDVSQVITDALRTGGDPNVSDAFTINGQPGDRYPCSKSDTYKAVVEYGKTYLLRVINAALADNLFFAVAGHKLTVVGTDASYTKPYTTDYIMITPGQTFDLLLVADQKVTASNNRFYMAARAYNGAASVVFDNTTTTAILEYSTTTQSSATPLLPSLPAINDTAAVANFTAGLRSLASEAHPVDVPETIDERLLVTVSVNLLPCEANNTCEGPLGFRLSSGLNNISFRNPTNIDILEAYYNNISGVYGEGFPAEPPVKFNYTGDNLPFSLAVPTVGTEVRVVEYNTSLEVVFQGTNVAPGENHPMHLHGQSFYVVGMGFGNFDENKDPQNYNLVDPPFQNTVGVPKLGWAALRFRTTNPGVWFVHCHIDPHQSWGMSMVFIVKDGPTPDSRILPPPKDMPKCP